VKWQLVSDANDHLSRGRVRSIVQITAVERSDG
jgi:hypothetical protein